MSDAWPIYTVLCIGACHVSLYYLAGEILPTINKLLSTGMQLTGGFIVVFSINSNMGTFRQTTLGGILKAYVARRPKRDVTINVTGVGMTASAGGSVYATGTLSRTHNSIEDRLDQVEQQIDSLQKQIQVCEIALNARIDKLREDLTILFEKQKTQLAGLSDRVTRSLAGEINPQLFGVLLASYGTILGLFG